MRFLAHSRPGAPVSAARRAGSLLGRMAVTGILVAVAAVIGWQLWIYYLEAPWTRDGRVRADVVQVAADVSGLVSEVLVHDNEAGEEGPGAVPHRPGPFPTRASEMRKPNVDSKLAAAQEAEREIEPLQPAEFAVRVGGAATTARQRCGRG